MRIRASMRAVTTHDAQPAAAPSSTCTSRRCGHGIAMTYQQQQHRAITHTNKTRQRREDSATAGFDKGFSRAA